MSAPVRIGAQAVRGLAAQGMCGTEIAGLLGVTPGAISRVAKNEGIALVDGRAGTLPLSRLMDRVDSLSSEEAVALLKDVVSDLVGDPVGLQQRLWGRGLQPKGVALVAALLRREGQIVPHDRIMAAMFLHQQDWPESRSYLKVQVSRARKALAGVVVIEAHPCIGYSARWVAPGVAA